MKKLLATALIAATSIGISATKAEAALTGCTVWGTSQVGNAQCTGHNSDTPNQRHYRVALHCKNSATGATTTLYGPIVTDPQISHAQYCFNMGTGWFTWYIEMIRSA